MSKIDRRIKQIFKGNKSLNSRYTLESILGVGGLCSVYKANDSYSEYFNTHEKFAIKLPSKELREKNDISAFIYSEYVFLRQICHKNIVKVYNFEIDSKTELPYIVMENIEGILLYDIPIHSINKDFISKLFIEMIKTLEYLHSINIVHADINPKNMIITNDNKIKLFDFGISQYIKENSNISLSFNKVKAFNPKYTFYEVLNGQKPNSKSDMFSLAVTFYEIFTSTLPYKKSSLELKKNPITIFNISKKIPMKLKYKFIKYLK